MVLDYKVQFQVEQIFVDVGDFTIYLMQLPAHQIMQHKMTEEH